MKQQLRKWAKEERKKLNIKELSSFVQDLHIVCCFDSSDSWVILSSIEQSIKQKIEAAGIPLKKWNIQPKDVKETERKEGMDYFIDAFWKRKNGE